MRVALVRGGDQPVVAAKGPVLRNRSPNQPTGIHLMRRSPTELQVQWTTRDAQQPVVRFGPAGGGGALPFVVPAATATYRREDMCGEPATGLGFIDPGLLHTAVLLGLRAGAEYAYEVGDLVSGADGGLNTCMQSARDQQPCQPWCLPDEPDKWPCAVWAPAACRARASSAHATRSTRRRRPPPTRPCTSLLLPTREWVSRARGNQQQQQGGSNKQQGERCLPSLHPSCYLSPRCLAPRAAGELDGSFAAMEFQPAVDVAQRMLDDSLAGPAGGGHYSLVLHAGDLGYARGFGALWDACERRGPANLFGQRSMARSAAASQSLCRPPTACASHPLRLCASCCRAAAAAAAGGARALRRLPGQPRAGRGGPRRSHPLSHHRLGRRVRGALRRALPQPWRRPAAVVFL